MLDVVFLGGLLYGWADLAFACDCLRSAVLFWLVCVALWFDVCWYSTLIHGLCICVFCFAYWV